MQGEERGSVTKMLLLRDPIVATFRSQVREAHYKTTTQELPWILIKFGHKPTRASPDNAAAQTAVSLLRIDFFAALLCVEDVL